MTDHQNSSAATEHATCKYCGTTSTPNDEPPCSTLEQAYEQTPTRPYGCPWFDRDSRKRYRKGRAEMSNLKDPERALVERCRADGFDITAGCNLVDLVRRAGLTLTFNAAQSAQVPAGYVKTMLTIIESQAQQIQDGRTIYDAAHRENARLLDEVKHLRNEPQSATDTIPVPKAALAWLDGAEPDADGKWFDECAPDPSEIPMRRFWWRSKFRSMIPSLALTRPQHSPQEK